MSRSTSVSSAMVKPGSRSASSGNSRSSDRQNASIVLIAMSPRRSRRSRQRAASISPVAAALWRFVQDALAHLRRGLAREGDREDVGRDRRRPSAGWCSGPRARASCPCRQTPRARRSASGSTAAARSGGVRQIARRPARRDRQTAGVVSTSSSVGDIILPAHAGIRARAAEVRLDRARRETTPASIAVGRGDEAGLRHRRAPARARPASAPIDFTARAVEDDVRGLADRPVPSAVAAQTLRRGHGIDGELQRRRRAATTCSRSRAASRRPAGRCGPRRRGSAARRPRRGPAARTRPSNRSSSRRPRTGTRAFRLHPQHEVGEARRHRGSEQARAFERRVRARQARRGAASSTASSRARARGRSAAVIAPPPSLLPAIEERLEHLVDEDAALARRQALLRRRPPLRGAARGARST